MTSALFRRPAFGGLAIGIALWWFSLVPSLLPRNWIVQAAVSAVCVLAGYAIGTLLGWFVHLILRRFGRDPGDRVRRGAWMGLAVVATTVVVAGIVMWSRWQNDQRDLLGIARVSVLDSVAAVLVMAAFVIVFGLGGRVVWRGVRGLDHLLDRRVSRPFAAVWTVAIVTLGAQILVHEVVWVGLASWANDIYSVADRGTNLGIVRPSTPNVSGSPASLVPWDTLGLEGRSFVAGATTTDSLRRFHGRAAHVVEPIRVYVGTRSAGSLDEQAALAVRELERTGAFDRAVLVVATATGTGWIDPDAATAVEQLYSGDTAIVSMQYSYLPSWIGFLIDQKASAPAGSVLFNAVYHEWVRRPATARPKLLVFGESLGSYGGEAAFAGFDAPTSLANLAARTDGAVFAGPVSTNKIWSEIVRERAPGSPVWRPVFADGHTARVFTGAADLAHIDSAWPRPRVAYLVYPSDPVPAFSLDTFWSRPQWANPPKGYDVSARSGWFPIVGGVQMVGDLINGFGAPPGHGHNYGVDFVGAWANVIPPRGWTDADTGRLEQFLAQS